MIVIGSYAAALGGFLPPWREGRVDDVDLIYPDDREPDLSAIVDPTIRACGLITAWDGVVQLDIKPISRALYEAFSALSDLRSVDLYPHHNRMPVTLSVAGAEAVWITLAMTADMRSANHKSVRDLRHYDALVGADREDLVERAVQYRQYYSNRLLAFKGGA